MKLRTKIFTAFSLLAIIPLLLLTGFAYFHYIRTIGQRVDDVAEAMFDNAAGTVNDTLDRIREATNLFHFYYSDGSTAIQALTRFADPEDKPDIYEFYTSNRQFQRICQNVLYSNDFINGIYVITPSGYIFSYTNGINGSLNQSLPYTDQAWYRETLALDGRTFVSTVTEHSIFTGGKTTVFFSQKLSDVYTHMTLGVLLIDCDPAIFDLAAANTLPDIALLTIENANTGAVLYTSADQTGFDASGRNTRHLDQTLVLSPLRLRADIDYNSLFREFNVTGMMMLLLAAVCLLFTLILSYVIAAQITRPLEHLSRKMAAQKGHSLEQSSRYLNRSDEIGTLYNEYNVMVDSLNAAVKQDYHDKLVILDAQMKSLEARINSHFLFNTLEAINSMAELEDAPQIGLMSQALGSMFRYTLKTRSELVEVAEELAHVQDYVTIQQLRFDNRFRLQIHMDEAFRRERVLKLILQPLVENALYHGLQYCTRGDSIGIKGWKEGECLYLEVTDNGCGIEPQTLEKLRSSLREEASFTELGHRNKQSIGLKNIHSRIELYYGLGYGLSIYSQPGKQTSIKIKLPALKKEE